MASELIPSFNFVAPKGYLWLLERGLVSFAPSGGLQPWHYLDRETSFSVTDRWPTGPANSVLIAFAKRQDNDDLACFEIADNQVQAIVTVHGWAPDGYSIAATYSTFWDWVKAVIDDVRDWCEIEA